MRVGRLSGRAFYNGRAADAGLLLPMAMELAEPDHLSLKRDEEPHRKGANRLSPKSGKSQSHGNKNFQKAAFSPDNLLYHTC